MQSLSRRRKTGCSIRTPARPSSKAPLAVQASASPLLLLQKVTKLVRNASTCSTVIDISLRPAPSSDIIMPDDVAPEKAQTLEKLGATVEKGMAPGLIIHIA